MASRYCSRYQSSVLRTHTRQLWRSSEGSPTRIQFLGYDDASLRWLKATARACCRADGSWVLFFFSPISTPFATELLSHTRVESQEADGVPSAPAQPSANPKSQMWEQFWMDLHQELPPSKLLSLLWDTVDTVLDAQSAFQTNLRADFVSKVCKACCKHCGAEISSLGSSEHHARCSHAQLLLEHK